VLTTGPTPIELSALQRQVLELSATGAGTSEVATMLGMSLDEVREHLDSAISLLGAQSKLEAVVRAVRLGLIRLPDGRQYLPR
jgi:two-component system, NarL family, nitrate/nitrite response regulator NarL